MGTISEKKTLLILKFFTFLKIDLLFDNEYSQAFWPVKNCSLTSRSGQDSNKKHIFETKWYENDTHFTSFLHLIQQ